MLKESDDMNTLEKPKPGVLIPSPNSAFFAPHKLPKEPINTSTQKTVGVKQKFARVEEPPICTIM